MSEHACAQAPPHHEGRPIAKRNDAATEIDVPTINNKSGVKSCSRMDDLGCLEVELTATTSLTPTVLAKNQAMHVRHVRMMERAVLKHPCVAPDKMKTFSASKFGWLLR